MHTRLESTGFGESPAPGRHRIPVEFIGMIATRASSETQAAEGPVIDVAYTREFARVHEEAGFDRVLIGYYSDAADGFIVAADVFAHTERLGVLLAHRPGFISPTVAARKLATLDQFSGGRLAVHVISGGSGTDQRRDGDYCDHDTRYRRTDEYRARPARACPRPRQQRAGRCASASRCGRSSVTPKTPPGRTRPRSSARRAHA